MFACGKVVDNNRICFSKTDNLPEQLIKVRNRPDYWWDVSGINCIFLYFKVITIHFHSQTQVWTEFIQPRAAPSGGGGTPLYKLYRYVLPHRVGFLRRFGLKTGINFAHFGLESVKVFGGITEVYEGIYRFNSKWVRTKEKYANSKWFDEFVCLRSNLSNDNIISA